MPTSTISNVTTDLNGNAVGNIPVVIVLRPPGGFRISDASEVAPEYSLTSNGSGAWSVALEETSNISPTGSFYIAQEQYPDSAGGFREYAFTVGAANATLFASLLAGTPPSPVTNYLTQIQGDARYAPLGAVTSSLQWKNIVDFGATGDGVTNDAPAIQAAHDALPSTGGTVYVPPPPGGAYYNCTSTVTISKNGVRLIGAGILTSIIRSNTVDILTIGTGSDLSFLFMESLQIYSGAGGGHCVSQTKGISKPTLIDVFLQQDNAAKSLWTDNGQQFTDALVLACKGQMSTVATEPGWKLTGAGSQVLANTWQACRFNGGSGAYVFHIENSSGSTRQLDNRFRDINFERPYGGCIKALAVTSLHVEDCSVFDLVTATTADLFAISTSAGISSRDIKFNGLHRVTGTLGGGLADIDIDSTTTDVELFHIRRTSGTAFTVNLNNVSTFAVFASASTVITGTNNLTYFEPGGAMTLYGGGVSSGRQIYPGNGSQAIQSGTGLLASSSAPSNSIGNDNDFYFCGGGTAGASTVIYHKESGAWVALITT